MAVVVTAIAPSRWFLADVCWLRMFAFFNSETCRVPVGASRARLHHSQALDHAWPWTLDGVCGFGFCGGCLRGPLLVCGGRAPVSVVG